MWSKLAACGSKLAPSWALQRGKHKGYIFFFISKKICLFAVKSKGQLWFIVFFGIWHGATPALLALHFAILFSESSSLEGFKTGPKRARVFSAHLIVIELYCEQKGKTLQSRIAFIILFFPRHDVSSVLAVSYPPEQVVTHDFNRLTGLYSIFQPLMTVRSWLRFFFFVCHQHLINK